MLADIASTTRSTISPAMRTWRAIAAGFKQGSTSIRDSCFQEMVRYYLKAYNAEIPIAVQRLSSASPGRMWARSTGNPFPAWIAWWRAFLSGHTQSQWRDGLRPRTQLTSTRSASPNGCCTATGMCTCFRIPTATLTLLSWSIWRPRGCRIRKGESCATRRHWRRGRARRVSLRKARRATLRRASPRKALRRAPPTRASPRTSTTARARARSEAARVMECFFLRRNPQYAFLSSFFTTPMECISFWWYPGWLAVYSVCLEILPFREKLVALAQEPKRERSDFRRNLSRHGLDVCCYAPMGMLPVGRNLIFLCWRFLTLSRLDLSWTVCFECFLQVSFPFSVAVHFHQARYHVCATLPKNRD